MRRLGVLLCALVGIGCQSESVPADAFETATVVENAAPEWADEVTFDSLPHLELGNRDGSGATGFAGLSAVRFLTDGRIVASEPQTSRLQVFETDGAHVTTLGRPGEGPDEFRGLGLTYPFPGDSVAAFDFGLSRTLIFSTDSDKSRIISGLFDDARAPISGVLGSGSLLAYQVLPPIAHNGGGGWDSLRVVLVPRDGGSPKEIARIGFQESRPSPGAEVVLAPRGFLVTSGSGFYAGRSDRYEIIKFDTLGAPQLVIRRDVEPVRLTAALAREYTAGTLEAAPSDVRERFRERLAAAEFAETVPLFGSGFVDHHERLWISEVSWPSRSAPPQAWSVFSAEGRWLGDVQAPEEFRLQDVRGDLALGVWTDELGVPFIRVYRLSSP